MKAAGIYWERGTVRVALAAAAFLIGWHRNNHSGERFGQNSTPIHPMDEIL